MKVEDFALIQRSQSGNDCIIAYHIKSIPTLLQYFIESNLKPALLAKNLGIHYQSCRRLLIDADLWHLVSTKNGKGSGPNLKKKAVTSKNGYLYSKDINSYKKTGTRARRKLEHTDTMERHLGRELNKDEVIHHIDGNKLNNKIDNLYLTNASEHRKLHRDLEYIALELYNSGKIIFKDGGYKLI